MPSRGTHTKNKDIKSKDTDDSFRRHTNPFESLVTDGTITEDQLIVTQTAIEKFLSQINKKCLNPSFSYIE